MMNGAYSGFSGYSGGGYGGIGSCDVGGGGFFDLSTLLFIGLAVFALYLFFKNRRQQPVKKESLFTTENSATIEATEIVRLRYARGDISFEEFQTILNHINS